MHAPHPIRHHRRDARRSGAERAEVRLDYALQRGRPGSETCGRRRRRERGGPACAASEVTAGTSGEEGSVVVAGFRTKSAIGVREDRASRDAYATRSAIGKKDAGGGMDTGKWEGGGKRVQPAPISFHIHRDVTCIQYSTRRAGVQSDIIENFVQTRLKEFREA
ncbi:hypothetical protein B0H19DRAFT_1081058 [Mycena capillaripes]|nr:hypothetical protein B0H19DRAFT_1081058 [Mycena capillaripes]